MTYGFQFLAVGEDLCGSALDGDAAVVDDHQPVGGAGHLLHGVGDDDDGGVFGLVIVPDVAQDLLHPHRVQTGGRLVQNEDGGFHGDDAGDGDTPLLTAGKLKGGLFQNTVRKANKTSGLPDAAVHLLFVESHIFRAKGDVFINSLFKKLILRVLEDQSHLESGPAGGGLVLPDVLSLHQHLAGGGL